MDKFSILWANEADDWIQERKRFADMIGTTWDPKERIYHPSNKVKKGLYNALLRIYDDVVLFTKIIHWFDGKGKDHLSMRIWFGDVEDRDGFGFCLDLWHEPKFSATYYKIMEDSSEIEVGRVIFEQLPSLDYNY